MKKLSKNDEVFLTILEREFSEHLKNVYKIAVCEYVDGTIVCVLIINQKKKWTTKYHKMFLNELEGKSGISLGGLIKSFNFTHISMEPTVIWKLRERGCNNWRYIK